ncbi:MAG: DUF3168 domain-containing protein [Halocynthiibacter sp.]
MSYGQSAVLQAAIYQRLTASSAISALIGSAIFDTPPTGVIPSTYISIGPEDVVDKSDSSGLGALHVLVISVITDAAGFHTAKTLGAAISDELQDADLVLSRGQLVYLHFQTAKARRVGIGETRRIDLTFHARVEDT